MPVAHLWWSMFRIIIIFVTCIAITTGGLLKKVMEVLTYLNISPMPPASFVPSRSPPTAFYSSKSFRYRKFWFFAWVGDLSVRKSQQNAFVIDRSTYSNSLLSKISNFSFSDGLKWQISPDTLIAESNSLSENGNMCY